MLPLRQHMDMRDAQLLVKVEDPAHACHSLLTPRVTARAVRTTPAAYLRGCLESVPPRPMDISMSRHIHNTYGSRVKEESEVNTILDFPSPQVDPLHRKNGYEGLTESTCAALDADITYWAQVLSILNRA